MLNASKHHWTLTLHIALGNFDFLNALDDEVWNRYFYEKVLEPLIRKGNIYYPQLPEMVYAAG